MYNFKTEDSVEGFSNDNELFDFINYSTKSIYYNSKKLVVGKMKDEAAGVAIDNFFLD